MILLKNVGGVSYHRKQDVKLDIDLSNDYFTKTIHLPYIFLELILHDDIVLCVENNLNTDVYIELWDFDGIEEWRFIETSRRWTAIEIKSNPTLYEFVKSGLNVTVSSENTTAVGNLIFKRCRRSLFTTIDGELTSRVVPYNSWDSTIHLPFTIPKYQNASKYVDFSTILPKGVLAGNDWMRKGFCMNTTLNGNIQISMSRCENSKPFTMTLGLSDERQIVRYWNEVISLEEHCPVEEESLPDHLWLNIKSEGHDDIGEVIIYNCHHTWVRGVNDDEEVIRITPTLGNIESTTWIFDFVVLPNQVNTYFAPLKHMVDTALVTGSDFGIWFYKELPQNVSFSACYKSKGHALKFDNNTHFMNLSKEDLRILSEFSNDLNCTEDKSHKGFYVNVGAGDEQVIGSTSFGFLRQKGVETPEGTLKHDEFTTVAFNLKKGDSISRNVNLQELIKQGIYNNHIELNQHFNCTGLVQLYVSRCEFSPKLPLFGPMKSGSAVFDQPTLDFMSKLYNKSDCLTDFQPIRYEYISNDEYGLYLHAEALEDSIGYVATYESFKAQMMLYELTEEHEQQPYERRFGRSFRVFKDSPTMVEVAITELLKRAKTRPAVSLRLFIDSSAPLQFAITKCGDDEITDWKSLGAEANSTATAWYTFDVEGVDLLTGYSESRNCPNKFYPRLYFHARSEQLINASFEFSIVNGTDLNQVSTCPVAEKLLMQEKELDHHFQLLLIKITMVVVAILGLIPILYVFRKFQVRNRIDVPRNEMISSSGALSEHSSHV